MSIPDLLRAFDANRQRADSLVTGLSNEQFNWRSEPGRWSIAQCLAHLNAVNSMDLVPLEASVRAARASGRTGSPPFHYGPVSRWFISSMEPPVKSKFKAAKQYQPPPAADRDATLSEYLRVAAELRRIVASAEGIDLGRAKTAMPALPQPFRTIIRMPLGARFELIAAHDRRHLWQAEQVLAHHAFPSKSAR